MVIVTCTVPEFMMALFGIEATACVELITIVVILLFGPKVTKAPEANLVPLTVRLNAPLLAATLLGESCEIVGVVPGAAGVIECEP